MLKWRSHCDGDDEASAVCKWDGDDEAMESAMTR
jgi:hypothetical protein